MSNLLGQTPTHDYVGAPSSSVVISWSDGTTPLVSPSLLREGIETTHHLDTSNNVAILEESTSSQCLIADFAARLLTPDSFTTIELPPQEELPPEEKPSRKPQKLTLANLKPHLSPS